MLSLVSKSSEVSPILVLPPFDAAEDLTEVFYKLAWYAAPYMDRGIRFLGLTADETVSWSRSRTPQAAFDSRVPAQLNSIAEKSLLLPATGLDSVLSQDNEPSCVVWDARQFRVFLKDRKLLRHRLRDRPMVLIDKAINPFESFQLPHFFQRGFGPNEPGDDQKRFRRFLEDVRRRPDSGRCNVYGGGYSLLELSDSQLPPGLAILCNAVITQHELVERLAPIAITITDPLLAGCSRYGELFREELIRFMAMTDAWVFTLDLYAPYYRAILPEACHGRVIGMPVRYGDFPPEATNLDFSVEFVCVDSWNVVTTLAIPLATTIADVVGLLGLDGIDPTRPDIYNSISIHDRSNSIGRLHGQLPGNIDAAYNHRHALALELAIRTGEARGKRFEVLTPSHYPVLRDLHDRSAAYRTNSSGNRP